MVKSAEREMDGARERLEAATRDLRDLEERLARQKDTIGDAWGTPQFDKVTEEIAKGEARRSGVMQAIQRLQAALTAAEERARQERLTPILVRLTETRKADAEAMAAWKAHTMETIRQHYAAQEEERHLINETAQLGHIEATEILGNPALAHAPLRVHGLAPRDWPGVEDAGQVVRDLNEIVNRGIRAI